MCGLARIVAIAATAFTLAACSARETPTNAVPPSPAALNVPYVENRTLDVYGSTDSTTEPRPTVVLVHGCCGDRADMAKLAEALADSGVVVFNATWAGFDGDARYPAAYGDVACAVRFARANARSFGGDPRRLVLVGWSDGAMAAAVISAAGDSFADGRCPDTRGHRMPDGVTARPDALVALDGYFGWELPVPPSVVNARTIRLFGGSPAEVPGRWRRASPYRWLNAPQGEAHIVIPRSSPLRHQAHEYARALTRAGSSVSVTVVPPGGDQTLISPRSSDGSDALRVILQATSSVTDPVTTR